MKITILLASMVMIANLSSLKAQTLGDPGAGLVYAKQACVECHWVEDEENISPDPSAPTFKDIANTPGMNARALFVWFRTPHPTMPNFMLEIQNEEDVIAYITSIKDKK